MFPYVHVPMYHMHPTHVAYFRNYIRTDNGFLNRGMYTTARTLTIDYW